MIKKNLFRELFAIVINNIFLRILFAFLIAIILTFVFLKVFCWKKNEYIFFILIIAITFLLLLTSHLISLRVNFAPYIAVFKEDDGIIFVGFVYSFCFRKKNHYYVCFDEPPSTPFFISKEFEHSPEIGEYVTWSPVFEVEEEALHTLFFEVARGEVVLPMFTEPIPLVKKIRENFDKTLVYYFSECFTYKNSVLLKEEIERLRDEGVIIEPFPNHYLTLYLKESGNVHCKHVINEKINLYEL